MTPLPDTLLESVAAAAVREGLADAVFTRLRTPIGRLLVVQGSHGVVRVGFEEEPEDAVLADVAARLGPRMRRLRPRARGHARDAGGVPRGRGRPAHAARRPLAGRRAVPPRGAGDAARLVAARRGRHVRRAAARAGNERASAPSARPAPATRSRSSCRATACCPAGGGIGSYGGGAARKRALLELEGALGGD